MTDLEWLARNVLEWNDRFTAVVAYKASDCRGGVHRFTNEASNPLAYTKTQWLAKRAELQNKPSWDCAPEWANWLAQDGTTGNWFWYRKKPRHQKGEGNERFEYRNVMLEGARLTGEVLGNWQDTLEERPNSDATLRESISETIEWNGEELPPVGCECERKSLVFSDSDWERVKIKAHHDGEICYISEGSMAISLLVDSAFRPLLDERQKAIDELIQSIDIISLEASPVCSMDIADYLYDQGYRKTN